MARIRPRTLTALACAALASPGPACRPAAPAPDDPDEAQLAAGLALPSTCPKGAVCSDRILWTARFTSRGRDGASDLAVAPDGYFWLAGTFTGRIDFGAGPLGLGDERSSGSPFVARFTPRGHPLMAQEFGGDAGPSQVQLARAVAVDPDGNAVVALELAGNYRLAGEERRAHPGGSVVVVKLAPDGAVAWSRDFHGDRVGPGDPRLGVDPRGAVVVGGSFRDAIDFGTGPLMPVGPYEDEFLVKLDRDGSTLWSRALANGRGPALQTPAFDRDGNILLGGFFTGTLDLGMLVAPVSDAAWIARLDPDGRTLWSQAFGVRGTHWATALAADARGDVYVIGTTSGTIDLGGDPLQTAGQRNTWLARFDPAGKHVWSRILRSEGMNNCHHLALAPDGTMYLAGVFSGTLQLGRDVLTAAAARREGDDAFVAAFTAGGEHLWSEALTGPGHQPIAALALHPGRALLAAGDHLAAFTVGGHRLPHADDRRGADMFIVAMKP